MEDVWRIASGTPWWVWVLFAVLMSRGIRALKPATAPLWRFTIVPAVILVWGIAHVLLTVGFSPLSVGAYLLALAAGCVLGWLSALGIAVRVDRGRGLATVPGGPATLVLILVIFAAKYTLGAWHGMVPAVAAQDWFILVDAGSSGLIAGMFLGRFAQLWRKYLRAPDEPLQMSAP